MLLGANWDLGGVSGKKGAKRTIFQRPVTMNDGKQAKVSNTRGARANARAAVGGVRTMRLSLVKRVSSP